MSIIKTWKQLALAGVVGVAAGPALGADQGFDMGLFSAEQGWYLRGDLSYNIDQSQERGFEYNPSNGDRFEFRLGDQYGYGIGFGKQFSPNARFDVTLDRLVYSSVEDFRDRDFAGSRLYERTTFDGNGNTIVEQFDVDFDENGNVLATGCGGTGCSGLVGANVGAIDGNETIETSYSVWTTLANGYIDLPIVGGLTPYVGGGIGLSRANFRVKHSLNCVADENEACGFPAGNRGQDIEDYLLVDSSNSKWLPTFALAAGVSYPIHGNVLLDLGYRYTHINDLESVFDVDGATIATPDIESGVHAVRAGVRVVAW